MSDPASPSVAPKVSVLMVTYNHGKFIAQAIESVLRQKANFPFELVIGEDCSTDGTREIVREYGRKRPEIIRAHLRERNLGAHENFSQIFTASRGRYLAVLEGDDYWTSPLKLQAQVDLLDAHLETTICAHRCVWHYENGFRADHVVPQLPRGFYAIEHLLRGDRLSTCSVMFRRVIDRIPAWHRELVIGDLPLFVELAQHGNIGLLEDCMGVYRIHSGGFWSGRRDIDRERNIRLMWEAFYDHLDPKHRPAIRKALFQSWYFMGLAQFTAGRPDETRRCLRECLSLSGPLGSISPKSRLALKGYGWWMFPLWRQMRRLWRRPEKS